MQLLFLVSFMKKAIKKSFLVLFVLWVSSVQGTTDDRPNMVWLMLEDWGPELSCYGTKGIHTPTMDNLAASGIRYTNARSTAPVCSTSRSAMITGFHQNYIGANQHRSADKKPLPHGIRPITFLLQDAGYFTCLMKSKKTDFNFTTEGKPPFQGKDWSERKEGQPFFAQITFGGTHRPWDRDPQRPIDIKDVELPPYYPDTAYFRRDWANGLEQAQICDREIEEILKRLETEGLRENTLIFLIGDHGRCHIRGKQFLYEGGLRIPMLMSWPAKIKGSQVSDSLVSSIDITATILDAAGVKAPYAMHGASLFSKEIEQRKFVFAARDKMDDTHDAMRAVVGKLDDGKTYKLIQNLMPERAYCQFNSYKESAYPPLAMMNVMYMKGELNEVQALFMQPTKPDFELFCLDQDPYEIDNLSKKAEYQQVFESLKTKLESWRSEIADQGVSEEFRKGGWPSTYPTASLEEWENRVQLWLPYLFRNPDEKGVRPSSKFKLLAENPDKK